MRNGRPVHRVAWRAPLRWGMLALVLLSQGCNSSGHTELPSLDKEKGRLLTKEDQKKAMSTLGQRMDAETAAAKKQIESR